MKSQLFKEVKYSLSTLIDEIDLGVIGLPDIQRPFVWSTAKVRDLFDSMYRGFPVGYLLFWENSVANGRRQIGVGTKQLVPSLLIVDGQQRLTSLYAVLKAKPVVREDYSEHRIRIAFKPRDATFAVSDAAIARDPEYIPDISVLWSHDGGHINFINSFIANLRRARDISEEDERHICESIDRLYDLQNYPFTALQLSPEVSEEEVAEVFVRINSQGVTLNQADFILTLMSVFWDEGRHELENFSRLARRPSSGGPSPFNYFIQPAPDQLLRVAVGFGFRRARLRHIYSILRGKDLETEKFSEEARVAQFEVLKRAQARTLDIQNWHEFLKTLVRAGYRSSSMIISQMAVVYSYVLFLMGKHDFGLEQHRLRDVIARWFFMVSLTSRYSASPESTMEQDLARLRNISSPDGFASVLDGIVAETLTEDYWNITLPAELGTSNARSPAQSAYYAALNLLDARVLFSKLKVTELLDPAIKAKKAALERHHLFARNYLKTVGVQDLREVNQIANYALVEWAVNIEMSDKPPWVYVESQSRHFSQQELQDMYYWHALPEGWERMDYASFLVERRKRMAKVIRDGFSKLQPT